MQLAGCVGWASQEDESRTAGEDVHSKREKGDKWEMSFGLLRLVVHLDRPSESPFVDVAFPVLTDDTLGDIVAKEVKRKSPAKAEEIDFSRDIKNAESGGGMDISRLMGCSYSDFLDIAMDEKPKKIVVFIQNPTPVGADPARPAQKRQKKQSEEHAILDIIERRSRQHCWPVKKPMVRNFHESEELQRIRRFPGGVISLHAPVSNLYKPGNSTNVRNCAMCSSHGCETKCKLHCSICKVPLCTRTWTDNSPSCQVAFHTSDDLMAERARRVALRRVEKEANCEAAKAKKREEMTGTGPDVTAM